MSTSHNTSIARSPYQRSNSPEFSDTLNNHLFITHVIPQTTNHEPRVVTTVKSEQHRKSIQRSLEEITKDIKHIEDFITVSEDRKKLDDQLDEEFYERERQRRLEEIQKYKDLACDNKENKSPLNMQRKFSLKSPIFKINTAKYRKSKSGSPNIAKRSRLFFKNGKIGCMDSEDFSANIQTTHQIVKDIIELENNSPLVSPENVNKILENCPSKMDEDIMDFCTLTKSENSFDNGSSEEIPLSKMFSRIDLSKSDYSESVIVDSPIADDEMIVAESPTTCCDDEGGSFYSMGGSKGPLPGSVTSIQSNVT